MYYELKVKPSDAVQDWAIFLNKVPVAGFNDEGEITLPLMPGEHFFYYVVFGAGAKLTVNLAPKIDGDPKPVIIVPANSKWPFVVEVPDDRTQARDRFYFVIGE
jgi:hypothetical protein